MALSRPLSSGLSPTSPSCMWEGIVWQMWYYRPTPMGFVSHSLEMGTSLYMYIHCTCIDVTGLACAYVSVTPKCIHTHWYMYMYLLSQLPPLGGGLRLSVLCELVHLPAELLYMLYVSMSGEIGTPVKADSSVE